MGVFDTYLAENQFIRDAEKCESEEERMAFCEEYLKKKGLVVRDAAMPEERIEPASWAPTPWTPRHFDEVAAQVSIDLYSLHYQCDPAEKALRLNYARKDVAERIVIELLKGGFIKFDEERMMAEDRLWIRGILKVTK